MYRAETNVKHEMYNCTGNNWSHGTGIVTEGLKRGLEAVPGNHSIDSPQKAAVLGTSHIVRKVLRCET